MEAFLIIAGIVAMVVAYIIEGKDCIYISFLAGILIEAGILLLCTKDIPRAIDVYRGRTELKITGEYKDSIFVPTDTIVIFKKFN